MNEMTPMTGASQWFTDAGIGYRGGYGDGGNSLLLGLLLARGGWQDHHGCHHKCDDLNGAQAILDRMSVNERQTLIHDARDSISERVKDTADRISERVKDARDDVSDRLKDAKDCLSERINDKAEAIREKIGCVGDDLKELKFNQRLFERDFCDFKAGTERNFGEVKKLISDTAFETRLRECEAREQAQRDEVEKLRFSRLRDELHDEQRCGNDRNRRDFEAIINSFNSRNGIGNGGIGSGNASGNTVIELAQTIAAAKSIAVGPTTAV